jgi:hypothetical protein
MTTSAVSISHPIRVHSDTPINVTGTIIIDDTIPVEIDSNLVELNGNTISTNSGVIDAGTQRISIATDDESIVNLSGILTKLNASINESGSGATQGQLIAGINSGNVDIIASDGTNALNVNIDNQTFGNLQVQSNSLDLATQSSLLDIQLNNFNIRRHLSAKPTFEIYSEISNHGSGFTATNAYIVPDNFSASETYGIGTNPTGVQLEMASSHSGDTSIVLYIEGYNSNGDRLSEKLSTDVTDGQTPVSSVNTTYVNVTKFQFENPGTGAAGIISLSRSTATWTTGNPSDAMIQIPVGSANSQGHINVIRVPENKELVILQLEINMVNGTLGQQLQLCKSGAISDPYSATNFQIYRKWRAPPNNVFVNYKGGTIIPFTANASVDLETYTFRILSTNTDATGRCAIRCIFTFEDSP